MRRVPRSLRAAAAVVALAAGLPGVGWTPSPAIAALPLPINVPPVSLPDVALTPIDTVLKVAAPGVLANDTDANGDTLSATLLVTPTYGTVLLARDGSYTYWPPPNWAGVDTFRYCAADKTTCSLSTLVQITVTGIPKPPPTPSPTPSLPVPTPTLPVPTPSLPVPTPSLPIPTPSLPPPSPAPTGTPTGSARPSATPDPDATPNASSRGQGGGVAGPGSPGGSDPPVRVAAADSIPFDPLVDSGTGLAPALVWAVPAATLAIPGLLVLLVVAAQAIGGLAWVPVVRRTLRGGDGSAPRRYRYIVKTRV